MIIENDFDLSKVQNKMPIPFLKDVKYKDENGKIQTIKGFLGSVKNLKAINEVSYDFLQPLKKGDKYINVQCSLSSFLLIEIM